MGPHEEKVFAVLRQVGWVGPGFVAFAARLPQRTVRHHLKRFAASGLAEESIIDGYEAYRLLRHEQ